MSEYAYSKATKTILNNTMFGNFLTTNVWCHKDSGINFRMPDPDCDVIEFTFSILVEMWYEKGDKNIFIFKASESVFRFALTSHPYLCQVAENIEIKIRNMIAENIDPTVKSVTFSKIHEAEDE